jgi:hypothetical protein
MRSIAKFRNFEGAVLMFALLQRWKGRHGRRESQRPGKNGAFYSLDGRLTHLTWSLVVIAAVVLRRPLADAEVGRDLEGTNLENRASV